MARLVRVSPVGVSPVGVLQHIIQRGNNRQLCFAGEADMKAYLNWLKESSKNIMLMSTPQEEGAISRMMHSIGRMYVRYYTTHINEVEPFGKVDLNPVGFKASDTCLSFIDTSN